MIIKASQNTSWGARAAWEAQRLIDSQLEGAEILDWGVDAHDRILWLNVNSGDVNVDIAVSRGYLDSGFFRQELKAKDGYYASNKPNFVDTIRRGRPGYFSQNGCARYLQGLDLQSPDAVVIEYQDNGAIPDFTQVELDEKEALKQAEADWNVAEKERQAAAKAAKAAAKAKADAEKKAAEEKDGADKEEAAKEEAST